MVSKRERKRRKLYRQLAQRQYSRALNQLLTELEMALSPNAILNSIQPLKPEDIKQVDEMEAQLDEYLRVNYYADGVVSWTLPEILTLDQVRELANRYRKANWRVVVGGEPENRWMLFSRDSKPDFDITSDLSS